MAIRLSNHYVIEWVAPSGALAFDGKGWLWDWPLIWCGLMDPRLFTVFGKTVTREPRKGNLRWWKPWECVRHIAGGTVNKVGLTNPGFDWWCKNVAPRIDSRRQKFVASIFGTADELAEMTTGLNSAKLVGLEINVSCPNTGHEMSEADVIVQTVARIRRLTRHPVILKLSAAQDYVAIARGVLGVAEAIALNSVPWEVVYPGKPSPLARLEKRVHGGGGGVSGKAAQLYNWKAVLDIKEQVPEMPVIVPSIWHYSDIDQVLKDLKADAVSFGAIHLRVPFGPILPTMYVRRHRRETTRKIRALTNYFW